jgi:hypothetical protein
MQQSHNAVSPFLLLSRRVESPSCSTWQIEQHYSHSNYQRRCHRSPKNGHWMGHIHRRLELGEAQCFRQDVDGVLWFRDCLVVPKDLKLCCKIMEEAHCSRYSIHPGTNKMYQDLKKNFWWTRMKWENVKYVSECDTCQKVKADHLRPTKNLQPLSTPEWEWKNICMNFIVGLPRTSHGYNSIWVIVDCLTKFTHFIPVSTTNRVRQYAELYMSHIVRYHGIPKTIIFWQRIYLCFSLLGATT